jgi:AraC-like DNA-binding protein
MVGLLPPHVAHDGRSATSHGYRKRVLYLDGDVFGEHLIGPAVDRPMIPDPSMYGRLSVVHELLAGADDALEAETRLGFVIERIRGHLSDRMNDNPSIHGSALAEQLRALLDAHLLETLTLASAGRLLGASPAHLVRSFSKTFGMAPHAYRLGRRIEIARQRLLDGQPPADVAASVGFYDQSHFTRHFKRHVGATPGRYAARPRGFARAG